MRSHWFGVLFTLASISFMGVQASPKPEDEVIGETVVNNKYFHEPGVNDTFRHYDQRYFKGVVSYEERETTLHHMIRAYLSTFRQKGLETWIAHGTLLGWWWNGKILPWDWDLDTQVSYATLDYLGRKLNQSKHHYISDDKKLTREYFLDVNPWIWERERGDGDNVIDARWIDIRNGLFIDITGLSETHPDVQPGVWSCKNYHRYRTKDLFPLRESTFEGVPAMIPYSYDQILTAEYEPKALVLTEYEGHHWDSVVKAWIKGERVKGSSPQKSFSSPSPHIPRNMQPRATKPGLRNVRRLFHWW